MRRPALTIQQRAALARLMDWPLRTTGRPDGAWRFIGLTSDLDLVAEATVEDLRARGWIQIAQGIATITAHGQQILAKHREAEAWFSERGQRLANSIRDRAARRHKTRHTDKRNPFHVIH